MCVCVVPHIPTFVFGFLTEVVALLATPLLFGFTECLARYPYGPELPDYTALLLVRIFGSGDRNAHVLFIASAQDFSIYERPAGVASCTGGVADRSEDRTRGFHTGSPTRYRLN